MTSLGAYLQVYKNNGRPEYVLQNFRTHYPDAPIYLVSDNGDDFSELAEKYKCKYEQSDKNTGISSAGYDKDQMYIWLSRFKSAFDFCNTDYMIYLEDDVLVRSTININESWVIAGVRINDIPPCILDYIKNKYRCNYNTTLYGACGGTIYKTTEFLKIYDKIISFIDTDFDYFRNNLNVNFGFLDMFMPIFFMMNGYSYDQNTELIESHRDSNWRYTSHSIIHGKETRGW